jgi:transposase InsO family protein
MASNPPADGSSSNAVASQAQQSASGISHSGVSALGPDDVPLTLQYINDNAWPSDFKLDLELSNWDEWSFQVTLLAGRQGFRKWLTGSFPQPKIDTHAKAHHIWASNDDSLKSFLFSHISRADFRNVSLLATAHEVFEALRQTHEKLGLHVQMMLIDKALSIRSRPDHPLLKTAEEIDSLHARIEAMGQINFDDLRSVFLLHCLSENHSVMRSHLLNIADDPKFSSRSILRRFAQEDSMTRQDNETQSHTPSILVAQSNGRSRALCTNCKRTGHLADFCIQPGGKMAGRSIDDAKAAQRAASGRPPRNESNSARAPAPTPSRVNLTHSEPRASSAPPSSGPIPGQLVIDGVTYYRGNSPLAPSVNVAHGPTAPTAYIETIPSDSDNAGTYSPYPFHSYLALGGNASASVDWTACSSGPDVSDNLASPILSRTSRALVTNSTSRPFILDSGASHHISPERSDFRTLRPIAPHPIQGFNGSSTSAVGIGDIDLCIASGHKLSLRDVLFVPSCNTRLVSVSALTHNGYHFATFGPEECWLSDRHHKVLARGTFSQKSGLYVLNCPSARVTHSKPASLPTTPSALYAKRVPDLETWHRRLGHCNNQTIIDMARDNVAKGMPIDLSDSPPTCDSCVLGKQTRSPVPKTRQGSKATSPLERVFVDLCGPMPVASRSGHKYSMNVIDDYSGYVWSLPLRAKSDATHIFHGWCRAVENQSGHRLKILVSDNGELVSSSMTNWCFDKGIDHQRTAPYTSAQNGRAERLHRTLLDRARSMRLACNAPASFWDEFCATAAYLTNLTGSSSINGRTPHELWFSRLPSLRHLREIGCRAFSLIQTHNPKIYQRSTPCTLIGYAPHSKAYRLWNNTTGAIFNSFHVTFIEHLDSQTSALLPGTTVLFEPDAPPTWDAPGPNGTSHPISSSHQTSSLTIPTSGPFTPSPFPDMDPPTPSIPSPPPESCLTMPLSNNNTLPPSTLTPAPPTPPVTLPRRSSRLAGKQLEHATALLASYTPLSTSHDLIPLSVPDDSPSVDHVLSAIADGSLEPSFDPGDDPLWSDALASAEKEYWIAGAREELQSLKDLHVFVLVPRSSIPHGRRPMKGKLVCKRKRDDSGKVIRFKVRYVAKGYAQIYGVDFDKTTAPTARLESFRLVLHLAAMLDWDIQQFDIKTAFLHGVLPPDEIAYMEQPPGFAEPGKEDWVMQLSKSIYGMRQASRIWNQTFHKTVKQWGFQRMKNEWCVYRRVSSTGTTIFALHVDDIICASSSAEETDKFRSELLSKWEISDLGPIKFALGIAISRDTTSRTISLSQNAYIDRILTRFGQTDAHPCDTPIVLGLRLRRPDMSSGVDAQTEAWMKRTPYRELVGSLNYLAVATRPDIAHAVGQLSSFLHCYRPNHWAAAIRVLRYIKGTRSLSLVLGGNSPASLVRYADSDFANCYDTSRSVSGYCFSLGSGAISWSSQKQIHTSDSTSYAEYIALHHAGKETIFLRELLDGLGLPPSGSTPLHCDNDTANKVAGDQTNHANIKHWRVRYHSIRDLVELEDAHIVRVASHDNVADIFTKPLSCPHFMRFRAGLGLRPV